MTDARDRFVRLAEARTTKVLRDIASLSNLSNRTNYSYSEEDVKKIFGAINIEIKKAHSKFDSNLKSGSGGEFKL